MGGCIETLTAVRVCALVKRLLLQLKFRALLSESLMGVCFPELI